MTCRPPSWYANTMTTAHTDDSVSFAKAMEGIDAANAADPTLVDFEGAQVPYELFYSRQVTRWVERLRPNASAALRLAARSQHICRWVVPRKSYPMTRPGYLKWRSDLKKIHAEKSQEILGNAGCSPELITRVRSLNLKENLGHDDELQVLEDALCLVTLEHQLADLIRKTEPEKLTSILQKTWKKMSPAAHDIALTLPYTEDQKQVLAVALTPPASEEAPAS